MSTTPRAQRGSGVFGTMFGLFVFLLLLLVAVNVIYALYARSMVTNAALDAARDVAGHGAAEDRDAARAAEDTEFRERIGLGDGARLEWSADDPDVVVVRVIAAPPSMLPRALGDVFGIGTTDREVRIRVERER